MEFEFSSSGLLLSLQLFEDFVLDCLSFSLHSFYLVGSSLLLLSIPADHLVLVLLHLLLSLEKGSLLIHRQDHISLRLLFLLLLDSHTGVVFVNHSLHHSVHLLLLSLELSLSLLSEFVGQINLLLDGPLVVLESNQLSLVFLSVSDVVELFVLEHNHVDFGILLDLHLISELLLNDLLIALLIQIGSLDLVLEHSQLIGAGAESLNFTTLTLIIDFLSGQFSGDLFFHESHVEGRLGSLGRKALYTWSLSSILLTHTWVKCCLSESHINISVTVFNY